MNAPSGDPNLLDRYLDDLLPGAERDRFERTVLADSAELAAEVQQQRDVDNALRRIFAVPRNAPGSGILPSHAAPRPRMGSAFARRPALRAISIAAVLGLGVFGGWRVWRFVTPPQPRNPYAVQPWRPMEVVYQDIVSGGFQPNWACKDDQEFATITRKQLGIPLLLAQSEGVAAVGWQYANTLGPNTMCLLATVRTDPSAEAAQVIVFADRARYDRSPETVSTSTRHVFRRALGTVVLYEISPLDTPSVVNRLYQPER